MSAVYTPITGNSSYKLVFDDEFNGTSLTRVSGILQSPNMTIRTPTPT